MKKLLLLGIFVLIKFSIPQNSFAKVPPASSELIIMISDAEPNRNLSTIETSLQNLGGITIVGFCNSEKCLFMNVDRTLQPNNDNIFRTIISLGYHPELKTSGSIQQAQEVCKDRN